MADEEKDKKKKKKTKAEKALEKQQLKNAKVAFKDMKKKYKVRTSLPLFNTEFN